MRRLTWYPLVTQHICTRRGLVQVSARHCSIYSNNESHSAGGEDRSPRTFPILADAIGGGKGLENLPEAVANELNRLNSSTLQRIVRDAAMNGHTSQRDSEDRDGRGGDGDGNRTADTQNRLYNVQIADKFGMPAELPQGAPQTLEDLVAMCPGEVLSRQLQKLWRSSGWTHLTPVQRAAIPLALEYRDVLCIAPTSTGKTLSYALPSMLRLALHAHNSNASGASESNENDFNRPNIERLLREKIMLGEVCRYCELNVSEVMVCPITGKAHPQPPVEDPQTRQRAPMWVGELTSIAEPQLLVLVPTSQLVMQVFRLFKQLNADFRVKFLVRASSAEEQQRHLGALQGCDVLISAPETLLPALYKHKLSLKRVKVLVLDEVDDLVSANHFEVIKIILGALPKGHERPQRLLFGASLPPVAYQMIKEQMLLPSHRFVLVDVRNDKHGHPLVGLASSTEGSCAAVCASITHVVFMVSQVEKVNKLAWLYRSGKLRTDQRTLIFCNSRHNVAFLCERLKNLVPELHVTTLTSRSSATAKVGTMKLFQSGASTCLICTDILSRGIDFSNVIYVVHYDMPVDFETWVHRSGRCGRHGLRGYSYTFFQPENVRLAKPLVAHLRQMQQLIPPKLQEYARQSLIDIFKTSLFYHPTRPYRSRDPQRHHPVLGRGTPRFPDYKQQRLNRNFHPL
ncbi:DEAD DEAH box helicase Helicase conserved C terminal domain [Trypanosoma vivax]|uniref:ATP-dependent RNA helicase n=1 Tax=Trypanosoma vivax (strain Y486) TaxID=1055687 RepID=G0U745_TRYVY|nr:putative DEAD/DEAH box helicase [Trypanosoma vivax]KAH8611723.1 DEAD DEAH box helicase Helicase conserved C terminal domain [Trypanosoma vivax]CCC51702.1 putative DEAD/DEAH box helicase [Trypanosoma vivax Y486]